MITEDKLDTNFQIQKEMLNCQGMEIPLSLRSNNPMCQQMSHYSS